jgi:outer membrane translocation and assembly module TamA
VSAILESGRTRVSFIEGTFFGAELIRRLMRRRVTQRGDQFSRDHDVPTIPRQRFSDDWEGIQFHFGEIQFQGPLVFPRETLLAEIAEDTKSFYTAGRLASAQRRLEDFYRKRGYFTINVEASGDPAAARDGKVRVVFQIEPGPIYRFDGVTVRGNQRVRTSFIEKRLRRLQGPYDPR